MKIKNVAKVVVCNDQGEVLLLRRSKTDSRRPGEWDFPGGGVEAHEDIAQAAARELHEEAGIEVLPTQLALIYAATEFYEPAPESVNRFLFFVRVDRAAVAGFRLSFEHDDSVWVTTDKALQDFPHPFYSTGLKYALDYGLI